MKTVKHHSFTLWVHSDEGDNKVPVCDFDEGDSFDNIMLEMLALDELGICCSLSCETWSTCEDNERSDLKYD